MPSTSKRLLLLIRSLHIYLSMLALLLLLFFAMTGFMMNHSEWFNIEKTYPTEIKATVPQKILNPASGASPDKNALIEYLRAKLRRQRRG